MTDRPRPVAMAVGPAVAGGRGGATGPTAAVTTGLSFRARLPRPPSAPRPLRDDESDRLRDQHVIVRVSTIDCAPDQGVRCH